MKTGFGPSCAEAPQARPAGARKRTNRAAGLLAIASATCALSGNGAAQPAALPITNLPKVEVVGAQAADDRREAPNSKFVVTSKDIERYGGQRLGDVLKRVPGVSVVGEGADAKDIRMRGMGKGYTQVLLDGLPVPEGFSLETLSPAPIDRIEILRSATAETSSQGIADTINVILKRTNFRPASDASASIGTAHGQGSGDVSLRHSERVDSWSYTLVGRPRALAGAIANSSTRRQHDWVPVDQSGRGFHGLRCPTRILRAGRVDHQR